MTAASHRGGVQRGELLHAGRERVDGKLDQLVAHLVGVAQRRSAHLNQGTAQVRRQQHGVAVLTETAEQPAAAEQCRGPTEWPRLRPARDGAQFNAQLSAFPRELLRRQAGVRRTGQLQQPRVATLELHRHAQDRLRPALQARAALGERIGLDVSGAAHCAWLSR